MEMVVRFIFGVACVVAANIAMVYRDIEISNWEWLAITFGLIGSTELI